MSSQKYLSLYFINSLEEMWKSESKQMSPPQDIVGLSYKIKSLCWKYKKKSSWQGFCCLRWIYICKDYWILISILLGGIGNKYIGAKAFRIHLPKGKTKYGTCIKILLKQAAPFPVLTRTSHSLLKRKKKHLFPLFNYSRQFLRWGRF